MNRIEFMRLWDVYNGLLTAPQREITDMYFNKDLTVSEIAEQKGVSRQAVSECLSGCKRLLAGYEQKLKFAESNIKYGLEVSFMVTDAARLIDGFAAAHPEFSAEMEKIKGVFERDYSAEAEAELAKTEVKALLKKDFSAGDGE